MVTGLKPLSPKAGPKRWPFFGPAEWAAQAVMRKIHRQRLKPHHRLFHRRLMRPESHPPPKNRGSLPE